MILSNNVFVAVVVVVVVFESEFEFVFIISPARDELIASLL